MAIATLEVRWFCAGDLGRSGSGVAAWFANAGRGRLPGAEPVTWLEATHRPAQWREDRYLLIPGVEDMGLKLREGRLEIKGRAQALGDHTFTAGAGGRLERWIKWSLAGNPGGIVVPWLRPEGREVVKVAKLRSLRRFALPGVDRDAVEVPPETTVSRGAHLELTRIRLAGASADTHWTLGVEGFPPDDRLLPDLVRLLGDLLYDCPVPLTLDKSMSYPQWLRSVSGAHSL